ncbi:MAG: hypothetical protein LBS25_05880, partial [Candidatus Symbiothrix sp.]|nr:hypothetical protein [Candidatus Symbiothrix sp.]
MKTKIFGFFAILLSLFIVACDVIPENDRITETDKITPMKKVLLLDFTDQACPNCPQAAVVVEQLKEDYAADFIPVTIHASPRNLPLVTSDGNAYDVHFGTNKTG